MSSEPIDVSLVPADVFVSFMDEIWALPLRKRSRWRGFLVDTDGVKRRVHFNGDELVLKYNSRWMPVYPCPEAQCRDLTFDNAKAREQHRRLLQAYERGGQGAFQQEHDRMIDESATGNHQSKPHKFKVPTAAGEPVRG